MGCKGSNTVHQCSTYMQDKHLIILLLFQPWFFYFWFCHLNTSEYLYIVCAYQHSVRLNVMPFIDANISEYWNSILLSPSFGLWSVGFRMEFESFKTPHYLHKNSAMPIHFIKWKLLPDTTCNFGCIYHNRYYQNYPLQFLSHIVHKTTYLCKLGITATMLIKA